MDVTFVGEHLLPGQLGHFAVILAFVACLLATVSFFFSSKRDLAAKSWLRIGRIAFGVHAVAIVGIIVSLFIIIYNHYFEYFYAWSHSSTELPTHFIISCFWEGQEGSFLLWGFWQMVMGAILIRTAKDWEPEVLFIICLSQLFISSMLLGVFIGDFRIGSSPFILLRNAMPEAPIFQNPNYLSFITDGNGLNPLLQNYWMVIHPPTLFFGFACTIVPFAYGIAGLWRAKYKEWVTEALPWTLIAVMVLGTGIIMGAFWAYEALNFGGYWAWDPVENASIIPWLTLVGALHVMIAYKNTGHALFTSFFLILVTFILVLYASFLTRSGILGDSSVHAFTDLGMSGQLLAFLFGFIALAVGFLAARWKKLPFSKKEEQTYSREFWLFIGALVLLISCLQIITTTSIPVINAIFGTDYAPPADVIAHYNKWQIPIAVVVLIVSGFSQFLKYKDTRPAIFWLKTGVLVLVSAILSGIICYLGQLYTPAYMLLSFGCVFSVMVNGRLLLEAVGGKFKLAGSAVAHIGFGLMLLGALISSTNQRVISLNTTGVNYGEEFDDKGNRENILLWENEPMEMRDYKVTYLGDSTSGVNIYYKVNYQRTNKKGEVTENFTLLPNAQINPKMGLIASPDTRHYLTRDIYTHVTQVIVKDDESKRDEESYSEPVIHNFMVGDSVPILRGFMKLESVNRKTELKDMAMADGDIAVSAKMMVMRGETPFYAEPVFLIKGGRAFQFPAFIDDLGLKFELKSIDPAKNTFEIVVAQKKEKQDDYIIMKAIVFPYINLLWGGTIIMIIGFLLSIVQRVKERQRANKRKK